jgi:alanine dehydrogenase
LKFLFDSDVRTGLDAADAVRAARRALVDAYKGLLAAPPRLHADLGERGLVFTAGGYVDGPVGFRVYGLWPGDSDQAVLVWDGSGRLAGCVVGTEIGARRTERSAARQPTRSPGQMQPRSESSAAVFRLGRS